jgi:hypothetical protein
VTSPAAAVPRASSASSILALAGAVVLAASAVGVYRMAGDEALLTWTYTHWAFTYEHGLVKRALVGDLVHRLAPQADLYTLVERIALLLALAASFAVCWTCWRPWYRRPGAALLAFGVVATTHVATLQHAFYDLGRFDQIGLLLALLSVGAIVRLGPTTPAAIVVGAACVVALLIHEAFLLMYTPLIVACWIWRAGDRWRWLDPRLLAVVAVHGAVLAVLVALGRPDVGEAALVDQLTARHGAWINPRSVQVLYGDVTTEMARSIALLASPRRLVQHVVLGAALLPTLWLVVAIVRGARGSAAAAPAAFAREAGLVAAALSPLVLYAIGIDFARWWALALTNLFVVLGLLLADSRRWESAASEAIGRRPALVWAILAVSLVAGPLGVAASPFPRIESAITAAIVRLAHLAGG